MVYARAYLYRDPDVPFTDAFLFAEMSDDRPLAVEIVADWQHEKSGTADGAISVPTLSDSTQEESIVFTKSQRDRNAAITELGDLLDQSAAITSRYTEEDILKPVSEDKAKDMLSSAMKVNNNAADIYALVPRINKGSGRLLANRFGRMAADFETWSLAIGAKIDAEHPALTAPLRDAAGLGNAGGAPRQ